VNLISLAVRLPLGAEVWNTDATDRTAHRAAPSIVDLLHPRGRHRRTRPSRARWHRRFERGQRDSPMRASFLEKRLSAACAGAAAGAPRLARAAPPPASAARPRPAVTTTGSTCTVPPSGEGSGLASVRERDDRAAVRERNHRSPAVLSAKSRCRESALPSRRIRDPRGPQSFTTRRERRSQATPHRRLVSPPHRGPFSPAHTPPQRVPGASLYAPAGVSPSVCVYQRARRLSV